ncbi:MAG: PKD domain-containing protein [Thermoplasmata archaeon]|nr:PKD domain-containing protein [Thermoplasmata archaeon]
MRRLTAIAMVIILVSMNAMEIKAIPLGNGITGDEIYGVAVDANGNVVVTGSISQGDSTAIKTQKYDVNGKLIWEKSYQQEGSATNVGEAVAIDSEGNIYVGGITEGKTSVPIPPSLSGLLTDYIILKYDKNGNLLWHKEYDNHFADLLRDIAIDSNGNVYATGVTIQVDLQGGTPTNLNFWTIKVNGLTGNIIAEDEYDRGGTDAAFGLDVKGSDVVVVGGTEENNVTKFVVVKYDTNLNKKWDKLYGEKGENAAATDAAIFSDGSIAVSGNKGTSFWTLLLNSNGNERWDKVDGTAYNDYSLGIGIDGNENIIVGNHVIENGSSKWHIIKYSKSGNVIWDKTYDIEGAIRKIAIYGNDIIAAGYRIVGGVNQYFVAKFDENGNEIWEGHKGEIELKADFSYYPANPTRNDVIHFTDLSTGATSWHWDFGDRTTSDQRNPTHQYTQLGTFTVTLTVRDSSGKSDSISKIINVVNIPPNADFSYEPLTIFIGEPVTFDGSSSSDFDGIIVNYTWDLGDGNHSYEKRFAHIYNEAGSYSVKLTVKDNDGSIATTTKIITVNNKTGNKPPIADFSFYPSKPSVHESVKFNASSSYDEDGYITLYEWDWDGDGKFDSSYTQPEAQHSWDEAGEYTVTLRVIDNASLSNTISKTIEVKEKSSLILSGNENIKVKKGSTKIVKLTIKNTLPYEISSIDVSVESKTDGINVTVVDENITLQPNEKKDVRIKIRAEKDGSFAIKAIGGGTESNMLYINVKTEASTPSFSIVAFIAALIAVLLFKKWKT